MGEKGKRMPRRYGVGGDGRTGRTWGGKLPEESGTKEQLLFLADNDMALYGRLTVDTLNTIRECGYRYEAGNLLSLQELMEQGLKRKGKYPEVYRLSLGEAKSRGELDRFWASESLNSACRLGMDSVLIMNFDGGRLEPCCLEGILKEYGFDRVEWILAHTIHRKRNDMNTSWDDVKWADGFHVPRNDPIGGSTWMCCTMDSPAIAVRVMAEMVRQAHVGKEKLREQDKPSILDQLAGDASTAKDKDPTKKVAERDAR